MTIFFWNHPGKFGFFRYTTVKSRGRHNLRLLTWSDRGFWNLRSDQVFKIFDPIKFDPIRFLKSSIRSSSIRSGFSKVMPTPDMYSMYKFLYSSYFFMFWMWFSSHWKSKFVKCSDFETFSNGSSLLFYSIHFAAFLGGINFKQNIF